MLGLKNFDLDRIALDPEGLSFYAALDIPCGFNGQLVRVDLASGALIAGPTGLQANAAESMAVVGEWRANEHHDELPRRRAAR